MPTGHRWSYPVYRAGAICLAATLSAMSDEPAAAADPDSFAPTDQAPAEDEAQPRDDLYREGVVDLLGVLAYAQLSAFSRLASDAEMAPRQPLKAQLAAVAVAEFHHYESMVAVLQELDADPEVAMAPFVPAIDAFHERTRPSMWLEGLVKAYIGDGLAADFYTEIAQYVDEPIRGVVQRSLEDADKADFVVHVVREAIREDHRVAGRLALFGRRMLGESLTQAQQVAVERDGLAGLVVGGGGRPGADLAEVGRMFARLTDRHTARMTRLGLAA